VVAAVLVMAVALPVVYYLASPLFINVRVDEQLRSQTGSPPAEFASGNFVDADSFHRASGVAKLVRLTDGTYVVRLEGFQVTNGPDLYVYLTSSRDPSDGFVNLGRLKGNIGDQNYDVPAGTPLDKYRFVIIWCKAFSVLFGYAELEALRGTLPGY